MPPRFLIVLDDEPLILRAYGRAAQLLSIPVEMCRSAEEALSLLTRPGAAGLATDYQLAEGTSLPVIRAARTRVPPLPVVLVSGNGRKARDAVELAGMEVPIVAKPVMVREVLAELWQRANSPSGG